MQKQAAMGLGPDGQPLGMDPMAGGGMQEEEPSMQNPTEYMNSEPGNSTGLNPQENTPPTQKEDILASLRDRLISEGREESKEFKILTKALIKTKN